MTLHEQLSDLVEHAPEGVTTITVEVDWLRRQLDEGGGSEAAEKEEGTDRYLTTSQAARRLSVKPETVAHWCREQRLPNAFKTGEDGDGEWRIPPGDVNNGPTDNQADDDGRVRFQRKRERES